METFLGLKLTCFGMVSIAFEGISQSDAVTLRKKLIGMESAKHSRRLNFDPSAVNKRHSENLN